MSICQDKPIKTNTMEYGGKAQLPPMLSPELAFSPPKPKKKISDDVTKFLRIDDCCHGCALVFSKNDPFQNGFNSIKFKYPYNLVLPFGNKIFSFNISVSQRATDENRGQLLLVLQSRGLPRSHFLNDVIAGQSANSMQTLLQAWR